MSLIESSKQKLLITSHFSPDYKIYVFSTWYACGKPNAKKLQGLLEKPEPESGKFPSPSILKIWIDNEFVAQAIFLDEKVALELENRLTSEKIEMLSRHATIGKGMQETAMSWLEDNPDLGNARTAITMLVEGLKVERESRGTSQMGEKFSKLRDDQLIDKLKELVMDASDIITIEPVQIIDA